MATLGQNITQRRKALGLSQVAAAKLAGVHRNTYLNAEHDIGVPGWDTVVAIANAFGVTTDELSGASVQRKGPIRAERNGPKPAARANNRR